MGGRDIAAYFTTNSYQCKQQRPSRLAVSLTGCEAFYQVELTRSISLVHRPATPFHAEHAVLIVPGLFEPLLSPVPSSVLEGRRVEFKPKSVQLARGHSLAVCRLKLRGDVNGSSDLHAS